MSVLRVCVCASEGERKRLPGALLDTNRLCRGAARPRETRGAGEGVGGPLSPGLPRRSVGLGGPGRNWNKSGGWVFFFFLIFPLFFFSSHKPTWCYFSKGRRIFHPATAAWFCQAPFLLRSSLKGKKKKTFRIHGSPIALSCWVIFLPSFLSFLNYYDFYICLITSRRGEHRGGSLEPALPLLCFNKHAFFFFLIFPLRPHQLSQLRGNNSWREID